MIGSLINKLGTKIWLLFVVVVVALVAPLLWEHFGKLWSLPYYRGYPVMIAFIGYYFFRAWRNREPAEEAPCGQLWTGLLFILAMLLTSAAYLYYSNYFICAATLLWCGFFFLQLARFKKIPGLFTVWLLLLFLVRLPGQLELRVYHYLELGSARMASEVIGFFGVFNTLQAGSIYMKNFEMEVTDLVKSPFSFFSVAFVYVVYGILKKRSNLQIGLFLLLSPFVVLGVCTIKLIIVGSVYGLMEFDVRGTDWSHLIELGAFGLAYLLLLSFDALVTLLFDGISGFNSNKSAEKLVNAWNACVSFNVSSLFTKLKRPLPQVKKGWNLFIVGVVAVSLGAVGFLEATTVYYRLNKGDLITGVMHDENSLAAIDKKEVTFKRPGWSVVSVDFEQRPSDSIWGTYSMIWRLRYHDRIVTMALDYPFNEWHDVKACYAKLGWFESDSFVNKLHDEDYWGFSESKMILPTNDIALILCSHCDHLGEAIQPKPTDRNSWVLLKYKMSPKRWAAPFGESIDKNKNTFYQTQAVTTSPFPLDEPTKREIRTMYGEFREQARVLIERASEHE